MKILSAKQIREADAYTIANEPIASIELMERASQAFTEIFSRYISPRSAVKAFCGTGNNGGDGLAISRLLHLKGYTVTAYTVITGDQASPDFQVNLGKLNKIISVSEIRNKNDIPAISKNDIVIDALFGSGLSRPVTGLFADVIRAINNSGAKTVAVDIASGLRADQPSEGDCIIQPELTISFQFPKLAFLIPENEPYTGKWEIADIGIDRNFIENIKCTDIMVSSVYAQTHLKRRKKFVHKGDAGKVLIISGSYGKMGAAVLSAKACIRSGTGLLTMHIPECGYEIMQTSVPEAMVSVDSGKSLIAGYPGLEGYNAIGIGPGIGTHDKTVNMLGKLLENSLAPIVFDADALNILSRNSFLLDKLPPQSIFTPHHREFERMAGPCTNHFERLQKQRDLSSRLNIIIVLKGANTSISLPDGTIFFNNTGNPGMATGGAGDVLTGIITALLGQKYSPSEAAILAVYLHGLAGDIALETRGYEGMIASDIIESLPEAFKMAR
ncbi:MAG TPA: NAD(P)H-hydrate dehydratase [Cyclobacteriaceae bacterium]|nr:NAD(P)H-hydrate dehydratase [Cyclobacteriaceae bacterium]